MTDLTSVFERLGLAQYLDNFVDEGFDSWDTVLYITESDLDALSVKLGHRRKLQREIAHARGIPIEHIISPIVRAGSGEDGQPDSDAKSSTSQNDAKGMGASGTKRKYRRHPRPDENAPERPPSAYVIFSNKVREELRPLNLSFTEIAKTVGERWQLLHPEGKEPFETQAASMKEAFNAAMAQYKRTQSFHDYQQYLSDFKARYGTASSGTGKRTKLESETSAGSSHSTISLPGASFGAADFARKESSSASRYSPVGGSIPHSTTPASSHRHRLSAGSQSGVGPLRSTESARPSPLPRILPLDSRDTMSPQAGITPLVTDAKVPSTHPRRSNKSPATLLHQDTSKSSVSSTFSAASAGSSQMTPVTPSDDSRSARPFQASAPQGYQYEPGQVNYPTLAPKPGGSGYAGTTPTQAAESAALSQGSNEMALSDHERSRSRSTPHDYPMEDSPFPPPPLERRAISIGQNADTSMRQEGRQLHTAAEDHGRPERLDALSVLALAGRMVDREPDRRDERK